MMPKVIFTGFILCLLVVICITGPSRHKTYKRLRINDDEGKTRWNKLARERNLLDDEQSSSNTDNGKQDSSLPSEDEESLLEKPLITNDNYIGVKYDVKKLSLLPSFKLNPDEIKKFKLWPKATVPFYIDEFSYGKILRDKIRDYLDHSGHLTGLNFEELPNPPDDRKERWVFIVNRRGQLDCKDYSTNSFTNSGVQKLVIGYDCLNDNGHLASVVLALAGVPPQHNAPDRDRFVNVTMESVLPDKKHLFKRLSNGQWIFHDFPYDYDSASHYSSHQYTADGTPTIILPNKTITPKDVNVKQHIQQQGMFSNTDLEKIRTLYNNIIQESPNRIIKEDTCNALYRPGPNSGGSQKLINLHRVAIKPKPKKYLAAVGKDGESDEIPDDLKKRTKKDSRGERLSDI